MATITNKHNLPEEVYRALCSNRYSADDDGYSTDYSATTLASPPQQVILKRRYPDSIVEDAMDRVYSMQGSIAHTLLQEHGSDESLIENRFYSEVLGKTISGQVDHYKDGIITDYKNTSAYKVTKRSYQDWERQLNIYAFLARENGLQVRSLRIIAFIRDFSEANAGRQGYPENPIVVIPITMWDKNDAEQYVIDRVLRLSVDEEFSDDELTPCTPDDMWETPTVWAVMKEGRKSAIKLHNSKEDAENHVSNMSDESGNSIYIQERKGDRRRCSRYCTINSKCVQYKNYLLQLEDSNGKDNGEWTQADLSGNRSEDGQGNLEVRASSKRGKKARTKAT